VPAASKFRLVTTYQTTWRHWKTGNKRCDRRYEGGITEGNEYINEERQREISEI
jgi:hypothetical protein